MFSYAYDVLVAWPVCVTGEDPAQPDEDATPLQGPVGSLRELDAFLRKGQ